MDERRAYKQQQTTLSSSDETLNLPAHTGRRLKSFLYKVCYIHSSRQSGRPVQSERNQKVAKVHLRTEARIRVWIVIDDSVADQ